MNTAKQYHSRSYEHQQERNNGERGPRKVPEAREAGHELHERSVATFGGVEDCAIEFGTGNIFQSILNDYEALGIVGEESNKLMCYLAATTRLMEKPLNILVLSSSGAGKSTLQDKTLKLMPPEDVIRTSAISDKALFYQKSLKGKILAIEEAAGMRDTYAIRTLISEGYLMQESVAGCQSVTRYVEGGCSIFQTTTNPEINTETKSRFFVLGVDESKEQTRRILAMQRKSHTLEGLLENHDERLILQRHHTFQRLLEPYAVVNPYAEELFYEDDRLQARRDQPKFLNLCKAVAFLNQMKKTVRKHDFLEYIEVDREDIRQAIDLASQVIGVNLDDLSIPARNLLELLLQHNLKTFTRREVMEKTGWTKTRLHIHLQELLDMELVILDSGRKNILQRYKLLYEGDLSQRRFLIGLRANQ